MPCRVNISVSNWKAGSPATVNSRRAWPAHKELRVLEWCLRLRDQLSRQATHWRARGETVRFSPTSFSLRSKYLYFLAYWRIEFYALFNLPKWWRAPARNLRQYHEVDPSGAETILSLGSDRYS